MITSLAEKSPTFSPLYRQIKALIMHSLQSGEWKPGDLMPSEIELATKYKVSQGTVRKAIDELAADNLVIRKQGKGTYVATHQEAHVQFRFLRLKPDAGPAKYPLNKIVEVKRVRASADLARQLELKAGDSVIYIQRVQSFDTIPTALDEIWLPGTIFKGLTAKRLYECTGSIYSLFETEFNIRMIRASEKIRAVLARKAEAQLLEISENQPLLSVERIAFTYGDKPVEARRSLYLTEHHHYLNELS